MTTVANRTYLQRLMQLYYGSDAKPTTVRGFLANPATPSSITNSYTLAQIIQDELPEINGYARVTFTTTADSSAYDSSLSAWKWVQAKNFTSSGSALTYNVIGTLYNSVGTWASKVVSGINTTTDQLTVTAHGLSSATPVTLTVDSGGTYPVNGQSVTATTVVYVKNISTNVLELYTDVGLTTIVNFSTAGSGTIRIRNCSGNWDLVDVQTSSQTIGVGLTIPVTFNFLEKGF